MCVLIRIAEQSVCAVVFVIVFTASFLFDFGYFSAAELCVMHTNKLISFRARNRSLIVMFNLLAEADVISRFVCCFSSFVILIYPHA